MSVGRHRAGYEPSCTQDADQSPRRTGTEHDGKKVSSARPKSVAVTIRSLGEKELPTSRLHVQTHDTWEFPMHAHSGSWPQFRCCSAVRLRPTSLLLAAASPTVTGPVSCSRMEDVPATSAVRARLYKAGSDTVWDSVAVACAPPAPNNICGRPQHPPVAARPAHIQPAERERKVERAHIEGRARLCPSAFLPCRLRSS